jgi:uncharacterized 2Fe-2S/4Fe-4S cluster protein (DUF4445 family)
MNNYPVFEKKIIISKPSLSDNRSIEKRIRQLFWDDLSLNINIPLNIIRKIPVSFLSRGDNLETNAIVVFNGRNWNLSQISYQNLNPHGIAVDFGSTSIVFYLFSYKTNRIITTYSKTNPQRRFGEDILARIIHARDNTGLKEIFNITIDFFNEMIFQICNENNITQEDIFYCTIAGNTTMMHLFLGVNPSNICKEPYLPVFNSTDHISPHEIGLKINPNAQIYIFPNVGSYFGGDLISGIISTGLHKKEGISLLVDVGTNAEVVLGNSDWLVATAGAAGPALEGGILSCGMSARPGAIERFYIDKISQKIMFKTIDNMPPVGICGSGAIDLLAVLFITGIVDETGKLIKNNAPEHIKNIEEEPCYVIYDKEKNLIYLSQGDIKNLVRSKGAMYTILSVIVESIGVNFEDIENFYVAGAFGSYIDPQKAITIGMLPDIPLDRFSVVGNSSGMGAVEALKDRNIPEEAEKIRDKITYIEMNAQGDFMKKLTGALFIPHTDLSRFPGVKKIIN